MFWKNQQVDFQVGLSIGSLRMVTLLSLGLNEKNIGGTGRNLNATKVNTSSKKILNMH